MSASSRQVEPDLQENPNAVGAARSRAGWLGHALPWLAVIALAFALWQTDGATPRALSVEWPAEEVGETPIVPASDAPARVEQVDGHSVLVVSGRVVPLGGAPIRVTAPTPGTVEAVHVRAGDVIVPGETVLLTLSNPPLHARILAQRSEVERARLRAAAAAPEARQADRLRAEAEWERWRGEVEHLKQRKELAQRARGVNVSAVDLNALDVDTRHAEAQLRAAERARQECEDDAARTAALAALEQQEAEAALAELERQAAGLRLVAPRVSRPDGITSLEVARVLVAPGERVGDGADASRAAVELFAPDRLQVRALLPLERASTLRLDDLMRRLRTRQVRAPRMSGPLIALGPRRGSREDTTSSAAADRENHDANADADDPDANVPATGPARRNGPGSGQLERGFARMTGRMRAPGLDRALPLEFRGLEAYTDSDHPQTLVLVFDVLGSHELLRLGMHVQVEMPVDRGEAR